MPLVRPPKQRVSLTAERRAPAQGTHPGGAGSPAPLSAAGRGAHPGSPVVPRAAWPGFHRSLPLLTWPAQHRADIAAADHHHPRARPPGFAPALLAPAPAASVRPQTAPHAAPSGANLRDLSLGENNLRQPAPRPRPRPSAQAPPRQAATARSPSLFPPLRAPPPNSISPARTSAGVSSRRWSSLPRSCAGLRSPTADEWPGTLGPQP